MPAESGRHVFGISPFVEQAIKGGYSLPTWRWSDTRSEGQLWVCPLEIIDHYDGLFRLALSDAEKRDLIQFLLSI
jgi:hypothetical protein